MNFKSVLIFIYILFSAPLSAFGNDFPKFNQSRYLEDYSYLKDPSRRTQFYDPIKFIPLNEEGDIFISFGGETRQHYENIRNENWGAIPRDNNGWYLQRYLFHSDLHIGKQFRGFFQIQAGTESGRRGGPRGVDEDRMDIHQLFVDWVIKFQEKITLRIGRQEIIFGARRFLNYRERPNLRLSHDAIQLFWNPGNLNVTGFLGRPVRINRQFFDNSSTNAFTFWGIYTVVAVSSTFPQNVDFYYIGLNREQAVFDQGRANELRQTIGTRIWGRWGSWDYDFELVYQFGSFGNGNISAWAVVSDTGYTLQLEGVSKIRFSLRADAYSGDDDPNDADLNAFNPFFPKGKHISQLSAAGLINQYNLHPRTTVVFNQTWSATASVLFIWRQNTRDGLYSIANGLLRTGQLSRSSFVGTQHEVEVKWTINRYLDIKGIFNFFDASSFLKETPPGNDITYLGTMLTFRF